MKKESLRARRWALAYSSLLPILYISDAGTLTVGDKIIKVKAWTLRMGAHRRRPKVRCPTPITFVSAAVVVLLMILALMSFLAPPLVDHDHSLVLPSESSNSKRIFRVPEIGESIGKELWGSMISKYFYGCSNASSKFPTALDVTQQNRFLMIATSGGLNQQRTGITDAVVAARILNATLVIPKLDQKSFWKDSSNFMEIFDVDWFISSLSNDVKIIKELPKRSGKVFSSPPTMRVPRKCTPRCYQNRVLPVLIKRHVVQLTKFDYRLANKLDTDLQKLRCRVNYHALKFTNSIQEMGDLLIDRMRQKSNHFIAVHLRFEPDMLAFSGCYYGGGEKERRELGAIRKRWKTLHITNPEKERRHGKCPLTPEEVGLMLRALGFGGEVNIYVASGEVYGGEETLAPLKALFPNIYSKETIATAAELAPFSSFSSRMAALDFIVCDGSDVFFTNNNGNMARILAGRRRYFGHKRTIRPNAKKLYSLFLGRANMTWDDFASKVQAHQKGFMGEPKEMRPGRGEFHENPSACICDAPEANLVLSARSRKQRKEVKGKVNVGKVLDIPKNAELTDDEPEPLHLDYEEIENRASMNGSMVDYDEMLAQADYRGDLELEERFSD